MMVTMIINKRILVINIQRYRTQKFFSLICDDEIIVEFIDKIFSNVETIKIFEIEWIEKIEPNRIYLIHIVESINL